MDLVIVPAYKRADFLLATLQRLRIADDGDVYFWICLDRGCGADVRIVAEEFASQLPGRVSVKERDHVHRGNSYNVMTSYQEALDTDADLIHLVEEDIFVGADYFDFHRRAHELCPDVFAVSACRNQNHPFPIGREPEAHEGTVYTHRSYQSLAVSFRPEKLHLVLPHVNRAYFSDMVGYCTRTWPNSALNAWWSEQDGLIHRVIEQHQLTTAYGAVARAYHAGFAGYNRDGRKFDGPIDQRAEKLLSMSSEELNDRAISIKDHDVIELDAPRAQLSKSLEVLT